MSAFCGLLLNPFTGHAGTSEKSAGDIKGDFAAAAYQVVKTPFQIASDVLKSTADLSEAIEIFGDNETSPVLANLFNAIPQAPIPSQAMPIVEAIGNMGESVLTALELSSPTAYALNTAQKGVLSFGEDLFLGIKNDDFNKRIRQRSGNILKNIISMPGKVIGTVSGTTASVVNRVGDASQSIADALDGNSLTRPLSYPFTGLEKGFRFLAQMANIPNKTLECLKNAQKPTADQKEASRPNDKAPSLFLHYER